MLILSIGSISAVSASYLKTSYYSSNYSNTVNDKSLFAMDRNQQLVFNNPRYYAPLNAFDFLVPQDATVAIYFFPNTFEYPLFGQYLTRTIIPINTFNEGLLAIPENADFFLYSKGYPCPSPKDKHLGADWFLRELNKNNRECKSQKTH